MFRRDTRRSLPRFHRPAWSPDVQQLAAGRLFRSVAHRGCASLACWRRLGLRGPRESGEPPSLAGQRHVNGQNVSWRVHVTVPEERLAELLWRGTEALRTPVSLGVAVCADAGVQNGTPRPRPWRAPLRLRLGRRLAAPAGLLQELVVAAADATRPELVDEGDPRPVDCCQSVPEPYLRRRERSRTLLSRRWPRRRRRLHIRGTSRPMEPSQGPVGVSAEHQLQS